MPSLLEIWSEWRWYYMTHRGKKAKPYLCQLYGIWWLFTDRTKERYYCGALDIPTLEVYIRACPAQLSVSWAMPHDRYRQQIAERKYKELHDAESR